jgi:hypothetical protein
MWLHAWHGKIGFDPRHLQDAEVPPGTGLGDDSAPWCQCASVGHLEAAGWRDSPSIARSYVVGTPFVVRVPVSDRSFAPDLQGTEPLAR